jgi:hypothetical protein
MKCLHSASWSSGKIPLCGGRTYCLEVLKLIDDILTRDFVGDDVGVYNCEGCWNQKVVVVVYVQLYPFEYVWLVCKMKSLIHRNFGKGKLKPQYSNNQEEEEGKSESLTELAVYDGGRVMDDMLSVTKLLLR